MNSEDYGPLVKNSHQKTELTQRQVAESLGVTPGYVSNVEDNRALEKVKVHCRAQQWTSFQKSYS